MIICPNCKHSELEGAFYCSECGSQLAAIDTFSTQALRRATSTPLTSPFLVMPTRPLTNSIETGEILVSLHFVENGNVMPLAGKEAFSLGRSTEGQAQLPDIDLSSYEAYGQGVSRLHAVLKIARQRCTIADLGSSNGTRVNGQKITPHVDYPLNHGDVVALGKLKVQILIRKAGN